MDRQKQNLKKNLKNKIMRDKYIEERFPKWFNHGGTFIAYATEREHFFPELPESVIKEHNFCVDALVTVTLAFFKENPEIAEQVWFEEVCTNLKNKYIKYEES